MMYVCLWSPGWSTAAASVADAGPHLAELAPRVRVEPELIWADGGGLDAVALATRLLDRLEELGISARAGISAVPIAAQLAARWGARGEEDRKEATPFLVKERTGWGWRAPPTPAPSPTSTPTPTPPLSRREREGSRSTLAREGCGGEDPGHPPSVAAKKVIVVPKGEEARWLAPLPISALEPDRRMRTLLEGVGVLSIGGLAALQREAVEVRFGAAAVRLWRLARCDDRRVLFRRIPPERPHGEIEFVDYVLTDPARLLFTANALLGPLCQRLVERGEHARTLRMTLPLADGSGWDRLIRPARPTASRDTWLRLIRNILERLTVPDAVTGMRIEVGDTEAAAVRQGDLFDRGFATAAALEAAVARLAERQIVPVAPVTEAHPLLERRARWAEVPPDHASTPTTPSPPVPQPGEEGVPERLPPAGFENGPEEQTPPHRGGGAGRGLTLQLLSEPRRLVVDTVHRRDHETPVRIRDRSNWREIAMAAGPDRISGGQWEPEPYAREYFRCVTDEGVMLWIYRDARKGEWYLHGWWD